MGISTQGHIAKIARSGESTMREDRSEVTVLRPKVPRSRSVMRVIARSLGSEALGFEEKWILTG